MRGELIFVCGGSGSGKSAWAERAILSQAAKVPGSRAIYLAAMENAGAEAAARIARHRAMRARHGAEAGVMFTTEERCADIGGAAIQPGDFVLLEDLGNLLANEIWSPYGAGADHAAERVLTGILSLLERACKLIVVSSDVFRSGETYDEGTMFYIRALAGLHRELTKMASQAIEVVCGIPIPIMRIKG